MKTKISNYTFDKTAKTVTFTDYTTIYLDGILLITNTTNNTIIYNFADSTKGGTVLTNVLTLIYNTNSMNDSDKLLIYYDDPIKNQATNESLTVLQTLVASTNELIALNRRIVKLLEVSGTADVRNRQMVTIGAVQTSQASSTPTECAATVPVSGTVTATLSGNAGTSQAGMMNAGTNAPPFTIATVVAQPVTLGPVDERWFFVEWARTNAGLIRDKIIFT
jgi:hypothetical protein